MIRPLVIDPIARAAVAEVTAFARVNWYQIGKSETIPGDDPRHVALVPFGYRCVFSFTYDAKEGRLFRQLTVSLPYDYPNPFAFYSIADLFGFTGWDGKSIEYAPAGWYCNVNPLDRCVVALQEVDPETFDPK